MQVILRGHLPAGRLPLAAGPPLCAVVVDVSAGTRRCAGTLLADMKIGEAARASGASARSLRHYEHEGLIVPGRCSNGFRDYCQSTVDRVLAIRSLLESGLPVRLIREFLAPEAGGSHPGSGVVCAEFLHEVQSYRDRLASRIAVLNEQHAALDAYLREARAQVLPDA